MTDDSFKQYTLDSDLSIDPEKDVPTDPNNPMGTPQDTQVYLGAGGYLVALRKVIDKIAVGTGIKTTVIDLANGIKSWAIKAKNGNLTIEQDLTSQSEIHFDSTEPNTFTGEENNTAYKIYREINNGDFYIADVSGTSYMRILGPNEIEMRSPDFSFLVAGGQSSTAVEVTRRSNGPVIHFPNFESVPSTCSVGDLTVASGKLYICTAANTWTVVGTQT